MASRLMAFQNLHKTAHLILMALVIMLSTIIKHLLALPEPVHEHIIRYVGGTDEDPETYGSSLAEVFP